MSESKIFSSSIKIIDCEWSDKAFQLAEDMIQSWDMDDLVNYATDTLEVSLLALNKEEFEEEYKRFHGEDIVTEMCQDLLDIAKKKNNKL